MHRVHGMATPPPSAASGPDALRRLMLDAARGILREPDTPLDLRKVAERAGKSRTAPYLVFGKESEGGGVLALRIAVAAEGAREMADAMEEAAAGADDPIAGFHAVALAFLDFVAEEARLFRLMYGPEINAVSRLGAEGFRQHPEFHRLLRHRTRAGGVVGELIERGQEAGLLRPELRRGSGAAPAGAELDALETPRARYLQIAWSTMIGVALLRDDQLLQAIDWQIDREQGARLIVESVFGLDPGRMEAATQSFLASRGVPDVEVVALSQMGLGPDLDAPKRGAPKRRAPGNDAPAHDGLGVARALSAAERLEEPAPAPERRRATMPLGEALDQYPGLRRAAFSNRLRSRPRILWIDDHPEWIQAEVAMLEQLGAEPVLARSTHEAVRLLSRADDDTPAVEVILSDIARGSRPDAGVRALPELARVAPAVPVIFFVADIDPSRGVPEGAAGITNRTDELLDLVVEALERRLPGVS